MRITDEQTAVHTPTVGRAGNVVRCELTRRTLAELIEGSIACIRVRNYFDPVRWRATAEGIIERSSGAGVLDDTNVTTVEPLNPGAETFPGNPMEEFIDHLARIWPARVTPGGVTAKGLRPYVFRVYYDASRLRPHIDRACEESIGALCPSGRLAANLYLCAPSGAGGELMLWDLIMPEADYDKIRLSELAQFERLVCSPTIRIEPEPGDLILFDAERIHCVGVLHNGLRVTASCFLGVGKPISAGSDGELALFA